MRLSSVLKDVALLAPPDSDPEVAGVAYDSRRSAPGSVFFALPGRNADGASFAAQAVSAGAAAVVSEGPVECAPSVHVRAVDAREALAVASANFYGRPSRALTLAGVTGTNGKTTTAHLFESIAMAAGRRCGMVGTIEHRFEGLRHQAAHTTPEAPELMAVLAAMRDGGADSAVLEVSSHALDMKRAHGLSFDVVAFSNLTRDHLDYHGTMEHYFESKARLFRPFPLDPKSAVAVLNVDDNHGRMLAGMTPFPVVAVSETPGGGADVRPEWSKITLDGIEAVIVVPSGRVQIRSLLTGRHNLANMLLAAGMAHALGMSAEAIERGISSLANVPGRLDRIPNGAGVFCFVDYAHTDDALRNVLSTLRELASGRIITVFGCGGDRDRGKRPLMGAAAAGLSDVVVVTSDNPRGEDPAAIIAEVVPGIAGTGKKPVALRELKGTRSGYAVVQDRREAIAAAAAASMPGDVLIIAGKGHEDCQIIGASRIHFDDREEAAGALKAPGLHGPRGGGGRC